jgi:hypothetical protein
MVLNSIKSAEAGLKFVKIPGWIEVLEQECFRERSHFLRLNLNLKQGVDSQEFASL